MNEIQAASVLLGLVALRFVAPLVLMLAIGYAIHRIQNRWDGAT